MFQNVQDQLQRRADALLSDCHEALIPEYLLPLALYLEEDLVVLTSPREVAAAAGRLRELLRTQAVHHCRVTVTAVELPRNGRFRVWGTWQPVSSDPDDSRRAEVVYYMRQTAEGMRSEMMHVVNSGSTELCNWFERTCQSA